jgi:hypothetical protein
MKNEDKINMKYLPNYGITEDILKDMIKYDIMFPIDKRTRQGNTDYFVKRSDVFLFVNTMLKNQMKVYEMLEDVNKKADEAKTLVDNAPVITEVK